MLVKTGGLDSHRQLLALENEIDISKYYYSICRRGGIEFVEKQGRWHEVIAEMGFQDPSQQPSIVSLRCSNSHLVFPFSVYYQKLSLGLNPKPFFCLLSKAIVSE